MAMRIESGPTGERQARSIGTFLLVAVFAAWFAYDGWIGYPRANVKDMLAKLPTDDRDKARHAEPNPSVTLDAVKKANDAIGSAGSEEAARAGLESVFGSPPSYEAADEWYYFGPALLVRIPLQRGKPTGQVIPEKPENSPISIATQKLIASGLAIVAVVLFWHVLRVRMTRLVIDDSGLIYRGRSRVAWDEIRDLDAAQYKERGWVDLRYEQRSSQRKMRLDSYHLAAFNEIVTTICERKGFANPLEPMIAESGPV